MTPAFFILQAARHYRKEHGDNSIMAAYADDALAAMDELVASVVAERKAKDAADASNPATMKEWRLARDRIKAALVGVDPRRLANVK